MEKAIEILNNKFNKSVLFEGEHFKILDNEKALQIIKKEFELLNSTKTEDKFINLMTDEINDKMKMKRLDMKTGWIIGKIKKIYIYLEEKDTEIDELENVKFTSFPSNTNWVQGAIGSGIKFEAKLFDKGSRFGIKQGRVSKLSIEKDGKTIVNYSRDWDIKPSEQDIDIYEEILIFLESSPKRF